MAFPAIRSKAVSGSAIAQSVWGVLMPTPISAGDRIVVWLGSGTPATTFSPGWTRLIDSRRGTLRQLDVWVKTADGTEDGTTVFFTTNPMKVWRAAAFAISGAAETFVTNSGNTSPGDMRVTISAVTVQVDSLVLCGAAVHPSMAPFTPPTADWTEQSDDENSGSALVTGSRTFAGPGTVPDGTTAVATRSFLGLSNDGYARATVAFLDATANLPPTAAFAVRDQLVDPGDTVHVALSGTDPDGTIASRVVTAIGPNAGDITLTGATTADATFTAPDNPGEVYVFSGTVTDDDSATSEVVYASVAVRVGATVTVVADPASETLEYAVGPVGSAFTMVPGSAPSDTGENPYRWLVDKRAQNIRFRLRTSGPSSKAVLRSLEVSFRPNEKP